MGKTSIEWTDASWNPIVGCTEISPGCANCYAARLAATRLKNTFLYKGLATIDNPPANIGPRWTGKVNFMPARLEEPLHWKKPQRIFVCDMGDLFHESVSVDWIFKIWGIMASCPRHTFQILTKRADRMHLIVTHMMNELTKHSLGPLNAPLPNVWLGVSVENQHFADERIPLLLATPAAVRWISAEPLLGPLNLWNLWKNVSGQEIDKFWVVCGGESGPNARPMHPDWARSLRDQCQAAGVPFFFKQWGEWLPALQDRRGLHDVNISQLGSPIKVGKKRAGRLLDGREWNEFPQVTP